MLDQLKPTSTCLFLQWTNPAYRYLLVKKSEARPRLVLAGSFTHEDDSSVVEKLQQEVESQGEKVQQAVVLLSRGDLDVNTHRLPPSTDEEAPELVANMVAQTAEDADNPPVVDFVIVHHEEDTTRAAMAFTWASSKLKELRDQFKGGKANLVGVTFNSFGAVQLLRQVSKHPAHTSVVVTTTDRDTDLSVIEGGEPVLFRTIPRSTSDEQLLVQQLCEEIRRTLTVIGDPEDDSTRVYLIATADEQEKAAKTLSEQLSLPVSLVNPLDQLSGTTDEPIKQPSHYACLVGIACAWNQGALELDLLHPRRPPRQPSPWRRVAFWSAIAAGVLAFFAYLAWEDHAQRVSTIAEQRTILRGLVKRATKSLELQDIAIAVESWRDDDIAWLDELRDLAQRLPNAEEALLRRITMSTDAQRNGVIDLAVQVSEPQVLARLEDAVRDQRHSVTSQRVTDTADQATLPWQFETRIVFAPAEKPPLPVPEMVNPLPKAEDVLGVTAAATQTVP